MKGVAEGFTTKAGAGPILLVILSTSEESNGRGVRSFVPQDDKVAAIDQFTIVGFKGANRLKIIMLDDKKNRIVDANVCDVRFKYGN